MPINATPEYDKAEQRYRQATEAAEQLQCLEEMLRLIPKHKGSEKAQSEIKRKISTLKAKLESSAGKSSGPADPYYIPKTGAGQIVLFGQPNAGKSSVLASVSHAKVKVEPYPYSTTAVTPGMWQWDDIQFQLIDTPPITAAEMPGELASLIRRAEITAIVADISDPEGPDQVLKTIEALENRDLKLISRPQCEIEDRNCRTGLIIATHAQGVSPEDIEIFAELLELPDKLEIVAIDSGNPATMAPLAEKLWQLLAKIRIYTRQPGSKETPADPFTLPAGATVEDLALHIHKDLVEKLKFARISNSTRVGNQQYHSTEVLQDNDLVELHLS